MLTIHKKKELKKGKKVYYEKVTDGSECQKTVGLRMQLPQSGCQVTKLWKKWRLIVPISHYTMK